MEKKYTKCPFCGEEILVGNGHHLGKCRRKYVTQMPISQKEDIIKKYCSGYSMVDMSDFLGFNYATTEKILLDLGLQRRSIKDAKSQKMCKEKYKQTCLKHFGTEHNFSRNCSSRKEWENRLYQEEGIVNVFQRESVKKKIQDTLHKKYSDEEIYHNYVKGSTLDYWVEKLGEEEGVKKYNDICYKKGKSNRFEYYVEKFGDSAEEEWHKAQRKRFYSRHYCGLNDKCDNLLNEMKISYQREFVLNKEDNIHHYYYDFKIGNLLIELNGTYWHCSPKKYKADDLVLFPHNHLLKASEKWEADKKKTEWAKKCGYDIETIWEDDFSKEVLIEILKKHNYGKSSKNQKNNKTEQEV